MYVVKELCEKFNLDYQFIKFLFVGGINTLFAYTLFSFLLFIGLHYALATLLGNCIGVVFNFNTTGKIVFKNKDNRLIFKFVMVYVITYFVQVFCLKIFDNFNFNLYLAGFILIFPIAMLSFTLMRLFVFKKQKLRKSV